MTYELNLIEMLDGIVAPLLFLLTSAALFFYSKRNTRNSNKLLIVSVALSIVALSFFSLFIYGALSTHSKHIDGEMTTVKIEGVISSIQQKDDDELITFESGETFVHRRNRGARCMSGSLTKLKSVGEGSHLTIEYVPPQDHEAGPVRCIVKVIVS